MDSSEQAKRKRRGLSLEEKIAIIEKHEQGIKNNQLCQELNFHHATISRIIREKDIIRRNFTAINSVQGRKSIKKYRKVEETDFEKILYAWLCQKRSIDQPVSGVLLRKQALYFYNEINKNNPKAKPFTASDGWFARFKDRHGLRFLQTKGEKLSADTESSEAFTEALTKFLVENEYDLDDVFNADESGLQFRSMPTRTITVSSEKEVAGHKPMKDRVTLMVCSNATGTHKIPLLVIGKYAKPRPFAKVKELPVPYFNTQKAWMNAERFKEWYTKIFLPSVTNRKPNGKKFLLLLDNAPSHPLAEELNEIDERCFVIYLPPNVTSLIQPMDQGVISALKKHYMTEFLRQMLCQKHTKESDVIQFVKKWTVLDCMFALRDAWDKVNPATLSHAWKKLIPSLLSTISAASSPSENNIAELSNKIPEQEPCSPQDVQRWIEDSHKAQVCNMLSDQQLLHKYAQLPLPEDTPENDDEQQKDASDNSDDEFDDAEEALTPITILKCIVIICKWARIRPDLDTTERGLLSKLPDAVLDSILELQC